MSVQALPGKSADADFLREMIGFAGQRLMDLDVGSLTGAGYGEKSGGRLGQRKRTYLEAAIRHLDRPAKPSGATRPAPAPLTAWMAAHQPDR